MRIEYRVTLDDMLAFTAYHLEHSPELRRVSRLWGFGVAAAFVVGFGIAAYVKSSVWLLLFGVLCAAAWSVFWPRELRRTTLKQTSKLLSEGTNQALLGTQQLEVREDGLRCVSHAGESMIRWLAIEKVASTPDHTFFYMGAAQAFVLPRAGVIAGDYGAFVDTVERHRRS